MFSLMSRADVVQWTSGVVSFPMEEWGVGKRLYCKFLLMPKVSKVDNIESKSLRKSKLLSLYVCRFVGLQQTTSIKTSSRENIRPLHFFVFISFDIMVTFYDNCVESHCDGACSVILWGCRFLEKQEFSQSFFINSSPWGFQRSLDDTAPAAFDNVTWEAI